MKFTDRTVKESKEQEEPSERGWASNPTTGVPERKGKGTDLWGEGHVRMEAEGAEMQLQARECRTAQDHRKPGRGNEVSSLGSSEGAWLCLHLASRW